MVPISPSANNTCCSKSLAIAPKLDSAIWRVPIKDRIKYLLQPAYRAPVWADFLERRWRNAGYL